jgi:hypothetical protein
MKQGRGISRELMLGTALMLAVPVCAIAQTVATPTAAITPSAEQMALAQELALVTSTEIGVMNMQNGEMALLLENQFASSKDFQELEASYPGIIKHMTSTIIAEAARQSDATLPALRAKLQNIYATGMTIAELNEALSFYKSPLGQRLIADQNTDKNLGGLFAAAIENGKVDAKDLNARTRNIAIESVKENSNADNLALLAFSRTAAFKKILKLGPEVQKVTTDWMNESTPEEDAEMDRVIAQTMEDYIAKAEAKKSAGAKK